MKTWCHESSMRVIMLCHLKTPTGKSFNDEAYLLNATALDSDNDAEVQNDEQWSLNGKRRIRFPFTGNSKIKLEIKNRLNPLEFFEIFFNDE